MMTKLLDYNMFWVYANRRERINISKSIVMVKYVISLYRRQNLTSKNSVHQRHFHKYTNFIYLLSFAWEHFRHWAQK